MEAFSIKINTEGCLGLYFPAHAPSLSSTVSPVLPIDLTLSFRRSCAKSYPSVPFHRFSTVSSFLLHPLAYQFRPSSFFVPSFSVFHVRPTFSHEKFTIRTKSSPRVKLMEGVCSQLARPTYWYSVSPVFQRDASPLRLRG